MKKIRFVSLLALLLGAMLFSACNKQKYFKFRISNGYYTSLTSISVSGEEFPDVAVGYTSGYKDIPIGNFAITLKTADGKFLSDQVSVPQKKSRATVLIGIDNSNPTIKVIYD